MCHNLFHVWNVRHGHDRNIPLLNYLSTRARVLDIYAGSIGTRSQYIGTKSGMIIESIYLLLK